ncbi:MULTISPECIES: NAD-dependent succinate-semialdehyde dehydrogenase [unclassified Variovorax]|uniref:NAD-dependent succinate-semialdehyde dehydrogenase n=1 Tax=unclassified Variovorax TaxID=663243 RepID=UPI0025791306|nr:MULTISPECIES: NAD-dependent succinate-semialdehyde dehydrogenase [unclassified Variovorax]MDM0091670.1 NAD-dependent succinate-semialdehyde dehydrogenase [Variovorax sp. J22G40]MDM0146027.1 NAD-dependent succinate-semialdehyde dehydrogenase [Variovorax sp. J2P1-31]
MYSDVSLFIDGQWTGASDGRTLPIHNPATGSVLAQLAHASREDLDRALDAADRGFKTWRRVSAFERSQLLRRAAGIIRSRANDIARLMTQEQGKPLNEARTEALAGADIMEWFAEEARRTYGRVIPARSEGVTQMSLREPVGPVAAFTPWNLPINQAVRKISAALAAGCSVILKGPEETPASCAELVRCYADAGLPAGVLNLVFGVPAEISSYLIPHPVIRKVTFTGSTPVGKQLAALAGLHMKRVTMELGGHAPVIVCDDADIVTAAKTLAGFKFRNAGQVCVSPTRFLVQEAAHAAFVEAFTAAAGSVKVGDGLAEGTMMGPLANPRRLDAMTSLVANARQAGARVALGGNRIGGKGNFFEPTVLVDVPFEADVMNNEPFGPLAAITTFKTLDAAIAEANRLPYGLAAYCFTRSLKTATELSKNIESGMVAINHFGLVFPEVPFGGVKDSGFGSEGGSEAIESYLNIKFVTQVGA